MCENKRSAIIAAEYYNVFLYGTHPLKSAPSPGRGDLDPLLIMVPWADPSLLPKPHLDWFSRFCIAYGRVFLYFTMGRHFPRKIALSLEIGAPSDTWFLGPTRVSTPNGISIG